MASSNPVLDSPVLGMLCLPNGFVVANASTHAFFAPHELEQHQMYFADPNRLVVFSSAKPALRTLLNWGLRVQRPVCLSTLRQLCGLSPQTEIPLDNIPHCVASLWNDFEKCTKRILDLHLGRVARLECLLLNPVAAMEHHGLLVDATLWQQQVKIAKQAVEEAKHEAKPIPKAASKIVHSYGESFLRFINPLTGRIHATFEPLGTSTGRMACHSPNLQNLPNQETFHRAIIAPKDHVLVTADYASCELRILGALANEEEFLTAFQKGIDLHSHVASRLFGKRVSKKEHPELRQKAKAINFGLIYGMGPHALSRLLAVSEQEAVGLLERYFHVYPKLKRYLEQLEQQALSDGFVQTVLGRKRVFSKEELENPNQTSQIKRLARNMPIQGTAADIIKLAMVRLYERFMKEDALRGAKLVNMIHDELVIECPTGAQQAVMEAVKEEMEQAQLQLLPNSVALVEVQAGSYWKH